MKAFFVLKEISGVPAEFLLLPAGQIHLQGYDPIWMDEAAAKTVIAAWQKRGNDMVIDYEHQTLTGKEAPAAGWIKDLFWKEDGLWAAVEWTVRAKEYLERGEYRYFSPVLYCDDARRVMELVNVALTNSPAIDNLPALVAKKSNQPTDKEKEMEIRETLIDLLELPEGSTDEAICQAVKELDEEVDALEDKVEKLEEKLEEEEKIVASLRLPADVAQKLSLQVAEMQQKLSAMQQQELIALALKDGKISPADLDAWGRDLALKSPEQFEKIVLSRPVGSVIPVQNAMVAKDSHPVADDVQAKINAMCGVSAETFKKYSNQEVR